MNINLKKKTLDIEKWKRRQIKIVKVEGAAFPPQESPLENTLSERLKKFGRRMKIYCLETLQIGPDTVIKLSLGKTEIMEFEFRPLKKIQRGRISFHLIFILSVLSIY